MQTLISRRIDDATIVVVMKVIELKREMDAQFGEVRAEFKAINEQLKGIDGRFQSVDGRFQRDTLTSLRNSCGRRSD